MARTTMKELRGIVEMLKRITGVNYHIDVAYGRPRLMVSKHDWTGGVEEISPRLPRGELMKWMYAYIKGIQHQENITRWRAKYPVAPGTPGSQLSQANPGLWRDLAPEEEAEFRAWARANYVPGQPINPVWHPAVRDEAEKMNRERGTQVMGDGHERNPAARQALQRLTHKQMMRMRDAYASDPLIRKPIDDDLIRMGWMVGGEFYGDTPGETVYPAPGTSKLFYDESGSVRKHVAPVGWPYIHGKGKWYVGINKGTGNYEMLRSEKKPTAKAFPYHSAVIGPFRSKRGAWFMAKYGKGNPHCQTVADAERLGKIYDQEYRTGVPMKPTMGNPCGPVRNPAEWEYYRISQDPDGAWKVQGFGHYGPTSVLAGQPRTMTLGMYDTLEEAKEEYPTAEVSEHRLPTTREMGTGPASVPPPGFDPAAAGESWEEEPGVLPNPADLGIEP